MFKRYDIIVVGGGHAGSEAAAAAANLGSKVLLITQNTENIAALSCNPAMGGVAKGQILREIDALGGYSAIIADQNTLQFRMLNRSKGPAMWSPRAQVDNITFSISWRQVLESIDNLDIWQDEVISIIVKQGRAIGVMTRFGLEIDSKSIILTNGTFLNGRIHIGEVNVSGGRLGDAHSKGLSEDLMNYGFEVESLKTGTPMRVDARSIDFSKLEEQKGDSDPRQFSFLNTRKEALVQKSCFLAYTSDEVHDILREGFDLSPMFQGRIKGVGPRYCPSIEDKIERFSEKNRHQLFIEPESRYSNLYYINGFSSSLPLSVQYEALKLIKGFENARIQKPGYAIEYDYFPPTQLQDTLETKLVENLYFAGQINGTTGYEEAGAQGLMAGINAHLKLNNQPDFVLKRSEAYIGVLIDDLITKGVDEPYRMFTSRAEHRILLRQDNADIRLTPLSNRLGLASDQRMELVERKLEASKSLVGFLRNKSGLPQEVNPIFEERGTSIINQKTKIAQLLLRPQINLDDLSSSIPYLRDEIERIPEDIREDIKESVEIIIKYESYITKEEEIAERLLKHENLRLKDDFDYSKLQSLSFEAREKLSRLRPKTIGQASRIPGVSPSDIAVLIVYISK